MSIDGTEGETEEKVNVVNQIFKKRQLSLNAQLTNEKKV